MPSEISSIYLSRRPLVLGLAKVLVLTLGQIPFAQAAPYGASSFFAAQDKDEGKPADDPSLWLYLGVAAALVLLGGAFAGLTIALMGQDEIYLRVIKTSGEGSEKKNAARVLTLLNRGKHWVLVTLLLSNVITNETLPIVLDRSLGGGWPAVLGSTVLIVIFGEIVPQSICVRYGLPIGAWMSPFVLALMYILAPVAWPTAKLLDYLLGKDHGTVYKKAGLKTLVSLHKSLGEAGQQLTSDEVTIITAVLDLKDKAVGSIMTPMDDVFTLSLDDVLDEATMDDILSQGYSRIPIHHPDNKENFIGMLLVKMLITYDPEDAKPVRDFALATLPETLPYTSCLDIINFFQEGKSHMILVSDFPGQDHGAIGVVTLEDVIEELIGEEIIDESDVFVDVHKAIRRLTPAPRSRIPRGHVVNDATLANKAGDLLDIDEDETLTPDQTQASKPEENGNRIYPTSALPRRRSSSNARGAVAFKAPFMHSRTSEDVLEHLKHLGPSNAAKKPRSTRYNSVIIKPGGEGNPRPTEATGDLRTPERRVSEGTFDFGSGIGEGILRSGGLPASDGVQAVQQGYGSTGESPGYARPQSAHKGIQANPDDLPKIKLEDSDHSQTRPDLETRESQSTIGDLPASRPRSRSPWHTGRGPARSGSITENIVEANGIRKVVLEFSSNSDSNEEDDNSGANKISQLSHSNENNTGNDDDESKSKLRGGGSHGQAGNGDSTRDAATKKRRRRKRKGGGNREETEPLLKDGY